MKKEYSKIVFILFLLFVADITKPFDYYLCVDFLFLGIIYISVRYHNAAVFIISLFLGYLNDLLCASFVPFSIVEFPAVCLSISYALANFNKALVRKGVAVVFIIFHVFLKSLQAERIFLLYSLSFMVHSVLMFLLLQYLLNQWAKPLSAESI
ncbi:MAG: hypothetical protein PHQ96_04540 [Candidatus Omnitrophica bacterium]|nr:hypothetical protein [Candidatus Omnitrophota bacterium]